MTIEERIQDLRKKKGLSQEQFADILGVSRQAVSKWEMGQSLPEVEKLIAMSQLFEVTVDYILKGGDASPVTNEKEKRREASRKIGSQIISAVAAMLSAIGVIAAVGQLNDGMSTMDIYGGLVLVCVGVMIHLVGWILAGNRVPNNPLFVVNILLAGILPSSLIAQVILGYKPSPLPSLHSLPVLLFIVTYVVICGIAIYFPVIRSRRK